MISSSLKDGEEPGPRVALARHDRFQSGRTDAWCSSVDCSATSSATVGLQRGMTLREVSAEARVSLGYISEIERGQKEASSELLALAVLRPRRAAVRRAPRGLRRRRHRGGRSSRPRPIDGRRAPPRRRRRLRRLIQAPTARRLAARTPVRRALPAGLTLHVHLDRRPAAQARLPDRVGRPTSAAASQVTGGGLLGALLVLLEHLPRAGAPAAAGRRPRRPGCAGGPRW